MVKNPPARGGGVMNWAIGIDMYTLMCIKPTTNKNLLYKKINQIKLKRKESACQCRGHGFEPWSRKISHAMEQLSPCTTTTEPAL